MLFNTHVFLLSGEKMKKYFLSSEYFLIMTSPHIACFLNIEVLLKASKVKCGLPLRSMRFGWFSLLVTSPEGLKTLPPDHHGCECGPHGVFLCHLVSCFKENVKPDVTADRQAGGREGKKEEGRKPRLLLVSSSSFFYQIRSMRLTGHLSQVIYDSFILKRI